MEILAHSFEALWQVALVKLLLSAGLPALFSLGMLSLNAGRTADGEDRPDAPPASSLGKLGAIVCFGIVIAAALLGIVGIVFGNRLFG